MKKTHLMYKAATRLGNINRFAQIKLDKPYNGAEHSFRVGILAMLIVDDYNLRNPDKKINVEEVLRKALIHDLEESVIGDIATPVKNRSKDFKEAYKTLGIEVMKEDVLSGSPLPELYFKMWVEDKSDLSGEIIKLADGLEAFSTANYELRRGNMSLKSAFYALKAGLEKPEMMGLFEKYPYAKSFFDKHSKFPKHIQALVSEVEDGEEF